MMMLLDINIFWYQN